MEFLEGVATGARALVLEGEPGIGKTTVWEDVVARGRDLGCLVLSSRPAPSEARLSFAGLGDLLANVPDSTLDAIPDPQRHALEIALLRRAASGPPPGRRAIAIALHSMLKSCAALRPVVIGVDDAQWLDPPTASALEFVVRRLGDERVGIVTSVRIEDGRPPTFDQAVNEETRVVARLGPLSLASLHQVIKERLGHSFPRPTLVRIERASRGNPFHALEIARELDAAGAIGSNADLPVPKDLRRLVLSHIRRLPRETRDALFTASALADPTTDHVDETTLGPAVEADVIRVERDGRILFSHPLFASVVYDAATPTRRRDLHARLAGRVGHAEERARHLALAASEPDEVVARALDDACGTARSRGAVDAAARLKREALRLTPPARAEAVGRRGAELGELLFAAGDTPGARVALRTVVDGTPAGVVRSTALAVLGMVRWFEGAWDEGIRLAEEALDGVDDREVRAEIHFRISCVCDWDILRGAEHARAALELLDEQTEPELYSAALLSLAECELKAGRGADDKAVARGIVLQETAEGWQRSHVPAYWARLIDDFETSRARHEEWLECGRQAQDDPVVCHELMHLGVLAFLTGDPREADHMLEEAVDLAQRAGDVIFETSASAWRAHVHAQLGRVDEARATVADLLSRLGNYPLTEVRPRETLGFLALSLGDDAEADRQYTRADELIEATGMREPADHRFHGDHIEAAVALGELERAEALLARLEARGRVLPRPWTLAVAARCRGLLLAARGDLEGAERSLEGALGHHERLEMPFELARTLLCLGRVQRRRKERSAARMTLERAIEIFEGLATPLWADRTCEEISRIGIRRAPQELTVNEERVAELAASGLTNKEIAAQLFMSRRTVEANLARAYRKLGIGTRAELGAIMAQRADH